MDQATNKDYLEGSIESIAFGGSGILRSDGAVTFVPYTAPGDRIRARIVAKKKNFNLGRIAELLHPSEQRTTPICQVYGHCGGCQLQHLKYAEQLKQKKNIVKDTFLRIGKISCEPTIEACDESDQLAYRRHIRLKLFPHEGGFRLHYVGEDLSALPIESCPIFLSKESDALRELNACLKEISSAGIRNAFVSIMKTKDGLIAEANFSGKAPHNALMALETLLAQSKEWKGIQVRDEASVKKLGDLSAYFEVDGLQFNYGIESFVQVHPTQSAQIYREIGRILLESRVQKMLDLYCGIGVTSIFAAKLGIDSVGIEVNEKAIERARKNAAKNLAAKATFICGKVESYLEKLLHQPFDCIVMNPPRAGLEQNVLRKILDTPPKHLIYVSCMPSTLARDARTIVERGYELRFIKSYDMFPQTSHVETLVYFSRT